MTSLFKCYAIKSVVVRKEKKDKSFGSINTI